jgi:hypothetical protein
MNSRLTRLSFLLPAGMTAFGILYLWGCRTLNFGSLTLPMEGFIPLLFGILFFLGSSTLMVQAVLQVEEKASPWIREEIPRVLALVGVLLAFVTLLPLLGFSLSTFGLLLASGRIMGNRWRTSVLLACGVVAVCYPIFILWLKIPLPSFGLL